MPKSKVPAAPWRYFPSKAQQELPPRYEQEPQQYLERISATDTTITETDEMSFEPFYCDDKDEQEKESNGDNVVENGRELSALANFLHDDDDFFPIEGGLERLDLMDTIAPPPPPPPQLTTGTTRTTTTSDATTVTTLSTAPLISITNPGVSSPMMDVQQQQQQQHQEQQQSPANAFYDEIEALIYGMNKVSINHQAALQLARRYPTDPVMLGIQALLERDQQNADTLWQQANEIGLISSKVEQGCGLVQALVGRMLELGVGGVKENARQAEFWYNQAAKPTHNNNPTAQYFLGLFHLKACAYQQARYWFELAAKQGHARAQMHFGLLFEHGHVQHDDYVVSQETAKYWYQRAAAQGDTKAACRLAFVARTKFLSETQEHLNHPPSVQLPLHRPPTPPHPSPPNVALPLTIAPLSVDPPGYLFADHDVDMSHDDVVAVRSQWQQLAPRSPPMDEMEQKDYSSHYKDIERNAIDFSFVSKDVNQFLLSTELQDPRTTHCHMDASEAVEDGFINTLTNYSNESALYERIEILLYGMNRAKVDHEAALELTRQYPQDPVMVAIQALLHRDGLTANELWKRANSLGIMSKIEQGFGLVEALVGKMLDSGLGGVKENPHEAEFWYSQAAKKGHATAECFLGLYHVKAGEFEQAKHFLGKAAHKGHARAQMHFGLLYEHNSDFETAKHWYQKAVDQGDTKASCRLDFVVGKRRDSTTPKRAYRESTQAAPAIFFVRRDSKRLKATVACSAEKAAMPTAAITGATITTTTEEHKRQQPYLANETALPEYTLATRSGSYCAERTSFNDFTKEPQISLQALHAPEQHPASLHDLAPPSSCCPQGSPPDVIKPFCAVMGDKSTRGARLTMGTKVLRDVKEWFKENKMTYQETGRESLLYEEAMQRYFTRMSEIYSDFPTDRGSQEATLLVKCTNKSLESERVAKANCFRYANETSCQYGTAKLPQAILFFFDSRDPPKLEAEVIKYRRKLGARHDLKGQRRAYFESYLNFCASTSKQAADGCPTAQVALESTNFIPALKKLWDDLEKSKPSDNSALKS